jgi:hypothetical protein
MRTVTALLYSLMVLATPAGAWAAPDDCKDVAKVQPSEQTVIEATLVGGLRTPTTVKLNGSPSRGTSVSWMQTSGPSVSLEDATSKRASFLAPDVGPEGATLTFVLTATLSGCPPASEEAIVNVTNIDSNRPPVAVADISPGTVNEGESFTLDGSASSDPDGDELSFTWERLVDGVPVSVSNEAIAAQTAPAVPYPDGATFTYRLTVSDGSLSASVQRVVTVKWVNDPPAARANCASPVNERASILMDGSASTDADDGIASYEWEQITGGPDANLPAAAVSSEAFSFDAPSLTFGHGDTMTFRLTVTDHGGLFDSAECSVTVLDMTPPVLSVPAMPLQAEATSAAGAIVSYTATATDAYDGDVAVSCTPASGSVFPLDTTTNVRCEAADQAGNVGNASFDVEVVDTTPPTVTVPADLTTGPTQWDGAVVSYPGASAHDLVDGEVTPVRCAPTSGSVFAFGANTVTCTAEDRHHNVGTNTFTVTVNPFTVLGFFQPVDNFATNTVKNGATVPVKWRLQGEGGVELTDVRAVASTSARNVACGSIPGTEDQIEITMTGGTSLRYDFTGQQFIFNWQTPKQPGTCWRLDVTFQDGTTKSANFKLK